MSPFCHDDGGSRGAKQRPYAGTWSFGKELAFYFDGRSLGVLKRTSIWTVTVAPLWRISRRRAYVAKGTMEEMEPPCRQELRVGWTWVEVELEKKNKSNLLDSEMLSHANPGGRA